MVSKILELSTQRAEGMPEDFIDLAVEPETLGQLAPVVSQTYQQAGRKLAGGIPPKQQTLTPTQRNNCCR